MARPLRPGFKQYAEASALRLFVRLITFLPFRVAMRLMSWAGRMVGRFMPLRGRVVRENLDLVYGDSITPAEKQRLMVGTYQSLFQMGCETAFLRRGHLNWTKEVLDPTEGIEHYEALRPHPKGIICALGHLGAWEAMTVFGPDIAPSSCLAKSMHNPLVQHDLNKARTRKGAVVVWADEEGAFAKIVRQLNEGRMMYMLLDQDAGIDGVFVDFLGHPASTNPTPALVALRYKVPILPVVFIRTEKGRYRFTIQAPIMPADFPKTGSLDERCKVLTQEMVRRIEIFVRRWPDQYFWLHRRWKTKQADAERRVKNRTAKRARKMAEQKAANDAAKGA